MKVLVLVATSHCQLYSISICSPEFVRVFGSLLPAHNSELGMVLMCALVGAVFSHCCPIGEGDHVADQETPSVCETEADRCHVRLLVLVIP